MSVGWHTKYDDDTQVEDDDSSSEVETLSDDDEDEDEGAWLEPSHGGGNLPVAVRRRLVPTVSRGGGRGGLPLFFWSSQLNVFSGFIRACGKRSK